METAANRPDRKMSTRQVSLSGCTCVIPPPPSLLSNHGLWLKSLRSAQIFLSSVVFWSSKAGPHVEKKLWVNKLLKKVPRGINHDLVAFKVGKLGAPNGTVF